MHKAICPQTVIAVSAVAAIQTTHWFDSSAVALADAVIEVFVIATEEGFGALQILQAWFRAKLSSPQLQSQSPGFLVILLAGPTPRGAPKEGTGTVGLGVTPEPRGARDGTVLQALHAWLLAKFMYPQTVHGQSPGRVVLRTTERARVHSTCARHAQGHMPTNGDGSICSSCHTNHTLV